MASILYVIHDIFPTFQQWGFAVPGEREKFGQKILQICLEIISNANMDNGNLKSSIVSALMAAAPNQTLVSIAATGDKVIQSLFESQANAEAGVGCELSKLVNLALKLLYSLIRISTMKDGRSDIGLDQMSPKPANSSYWASEIRKWNLFIDGAFMT